MDRKAFVSMAIDPRGQKHTTNENYCPFFKGHPHGNGRVNQLLVLTLIRLYTEQNTEFSNQLCGSQLLK
jgi:hypothetical protein